LERCITLPCGRSIHLNVEVCMKVETQLRRADLSLYDRLLVEDALDPNQSHSLPPNRRWVPTLEWYDRAVGGAVNPPEPMDKPERVRLRDKDVPQDKVDLTVFLLKSSTLSYGEIAKLAELKWNSTVQQIAKKYKLRSYAVVTPVNRQQYKESRSFTPLQKEQFEYRRILAEVLRRNPEASYQEVADSLNISVSTVFKAAEEFGVVETRRHRGRPNMGKGDRRGLHYRARRCWVQNCLVRRKKGLAPLPKEAFMADFYARHGGTPSAVEGPAAPIPCPQDWGEV